VVDIFDEVDEELRADRAQELLKRYAGWIIGAGALIVAGAGGYQGWHWWQVKQDLAAATQYIDAMNATASAGVAGPDRPAAIARFDAVVAGAPHGYGTLARLQDAALKADNGDLQGAAMLWDQVAGDRNAEPLLRELASLLWAQRQINTGDPALLEARLKPLAEPGGAWRSLAQEQLALLDLRQNKTDAAKDLLRKLAQDVTAPAGVRGRASALLTKLGE
jgi:hypothetical protein